jgi:lysozyme family protein
VKATFPHALAVVLKHEGGWSDHPQDPGGATMRGVTLKTFSEVLGRPATKEELRQITDEQLRKIYRGRYWNAACADQLPAGLDLVVFDMAVNAGPRRAVRMLQALLGVTTDGAVGPRTLAAVGLHDPGTLIQEYSHERRSYYRSLSTFQTFGRGWLRRVEEVEAEALKLIGESHDE